MLFCSAVWFSKCKCHVKWGFPAQGTWQVWTKLLDRKPLQCHCPTQMQQKLAQDWSQSGVCSVKYWVQHSPIAQSIFQINTRVWQLFVGFSHHTVKVCYDVSVGCIAATLRITACASGGRWNKMEEGRGPKYMQQRSPRAKVLLYCGNTISLLSPIPIKIMHITWIHL